LWVGVGEGDMESAESFPKEFLQGRGTGGSGIMFT
jgi:hypothetical protein